MGMIRIRRESIQNVNLLMPFNVKTTFTYFNQKFKYTWRRFDITYRLMKHKCISLTIMESKYHSIIKKTL